MTSPAILGACTLALLASAAALAGPERIAWPEGYAERFVLYNMVDRPDRGTVRFMYVDRASHDAARPGEPLPYGTVLIMEDHKARIEGDRPARDSDGRLVPAEEVTNVFLMQKEQGWGEAYPPELRNGDWDYAWFLPDGSRKADAKFEGCFSCHLNREGERDFTFTFAKYVLDGKPRH
ncbi:cytochrome P460 family protein [Geminicoccaceae bacterium 1502E]|nr:cytochrome P460 family protein [Geminicoccaceae bacterium 1502E]